MKTYAFGRKIELLEKFAHPAVGIFATAQESEKGQVKRGPDYRKKERPFHLDRKIFHLARSLKNSLLSLML